MTIVVSTIEAQGRYCIMEMKHEKLIGPATHIHPEGPEIFYVLEGEYTVHCNSQTVSLKPFDSFTVPANTAHSYKSGPQGGRLLIVMPPYLENYFVKIAELESKGFVAPKEEQQIAKIYGQEFLDFNSHW